MAINFRGLLACVALLVVTRADNVRKPRQRQGAVLPDDESFKFKTMYSDTYSQWSANQPQHTPNYMVSTCGASFDCSGEVTNTQAKAASTGTADYKGTAAECCEAPPAPAPTKLFTKTAELCTEESLIEDRVVCKLAARVLGLEKPTSAGKEWEKGCLFNGGKAYFSPVSSSDKVDTGNAKTDEYICNPGPIEMTTMTCEEADLITITSEEECKSLAATNGFFYAGKAGPEWQQGCLYNNGNNIYFSPAVDKTEAGQKETLAYLCKKNPKAPVEVKKTEEDTAQTPEAKTETETTPRLQPGAHDCVTATLGPSPTKSKSYTLKDKSYVCPKAISKENWVGKNYDGVSAYERYNDKFTVVQTGAELTVSRSDTAETDPSGWSLDLQFTCCWKDGAAYHTVYTE